MGKTFKPPRVEVVLPNGQTRMVAEDMVKDMARFGAVLSSARSIKNPPPELLNMPVPRKVAMPVLPEVPPPIDTGAEYPKDEKPVVLDESKVVVKKVGRKKK